MIKPTFALIPSAYKNGVYPSADGKIYTILPNNADGDYDSFERNGFGYKVNEQKILEQTTSNDPLIDHLHDCPSLVLERGSANNITFSEAISDGSWGKQSCAVYDDEAIAPNGKLTADRVEINNTSSSGYVYKTLNLSVNQWKSFSVFVKNVNNEQTYAKADVWNSVTGTWSSVSLRFDDEDITSSGLYLDYASVDKYPNGWYRLKFTFRVPSSYSGSNYFRIFGQNGYGNSFYVWGAQEEDDRNITSYIPTLSTVVSRQRNNMLGADFFDYFNKDEGVLYVDFEPTAVTSQSVATRVGIGRNLFSEYMQISSSITSVTDYTTLLNFSVFIPYSAILNFNYTIEVRQRIKCAIVYRRGLGSPSGYYKVFVNGVLENTTYASSFMQSSPKRMVLGSPTGNSSNTFNGRVYDFRYYDKEINDADMIKLTTL